MTVALPYALAALLLAYAALTALCLGMDKHWRQCLPQLTPHGIGTSAPLPHWLAAERHRLQRTLRRFGWLLTALTLLPCLLGWGGPMGLALWPGFFSVAGTVLIFLLPYRPRLTPGLGLAALLLGVFCLLLPLSQTHAI